MERRKSKRNPAKVRTEIRYHDSIHYGVIENLSASGARLLTDHIENTEEFRQYDPVELKFRTYAGKEFTVKCTIMWADYIPPRNERCRIGLELVGKPWDAISQFVKQGSN